MPDQFLPQIAINSTQILPQLKSGQLLMLAPQRQGGLIICKTHHAEFAGPGAGVGGLFDITCVRVIPIGDVALVFPESYETRQQAYANRQKWIERTQQAMQDPVPLRRAIAILNLFEQEFDTQTVSSLPDDALAMLVGVFPRTIEMARRADQGLDESNIKNRRISPIVTAGTSNCGVNPTSSSN